MEDTITQKPARSFLRWAGSKRQLLPFLNQFWDKGYTRYVEPFAGSASLFFEIQPSQALLGDLNHDLMETYETVRTSPKKVSTSLSRLRLGEKSYYKIRRRDAGELGKIERAAQFIYLNRFCFNGIYRTNLAGKFNVPYGAPKSGQLPTLAHLKFCSAALKNAKLLCADYKETLRNVKEGDFVYIDPPYAVTSRRVFVEYSAKPFSTQDLADLEKLLNTIDQKGAHFVLSYIYCRETQKRFRKWHRRRMSIRRNIAGFTKSRGKAYELCVTNINRPMSSN